MPKVRIVIAEDHTLLADAYKTLLGPEYDIVGLAPDGRALLAMVRDLRPDIVILDIFMPLLNGLDAGRQVKKIDPSVALIFVTANEDPVLASEAFRAGASAYLLKRSAGVELRDAIREVMKRRSYVTPLVADGATGSPIRPPAPPELPHELSTRQREVLQLLAEGKSMKEVATILDLTPRTVAFHKYRIMHQLRIRTNAELIQFAIRNHIV